MKAKSFLLLILALSAALISCKRKPSPPPNPEPVVRKPVIYLYPTQQETVDVKVHFNGKLTATYPPGENGWEVVASPDGKLINTADGSVHHYLFYEGEQKEMKPIYSGFYVKKENLIPFLQKSLAQIGLLPHEYNDMITYWLPELNKMPVNFIHFSINEECNSYSTLEVIPAPDTEIRVMMEFVGLSENEIGDNPTWEEKNQPGQKEDLGSIQFLPHFDRKGFTLVEWGGRQQTRETLQFYPFIPPAVAEKPVIYLYPETEINAEVTVEMDNGLSVSYPPYNNGWKVKAKPDGSLIDLTDNHPYNNLFYEGVVDPPQAFSTGFCAGRDFVLRQIDFQLKQLGLNAREAEDMVTYWAQRLTEKPWVVYHFALNEEVDFYSRIHCTPQPQSQLRVMLIFAQFDQQVELPGQRLPSFSREGFTLVEWGGIQTQREAVVLPQQAPGIYSLKPVIYLYPQTAQEISVKFDYKGTLSATWPDYAGEWKVKATPEGKLTNLRDQQEHSYLFYEGNLSQQYSLKDGFVVKRENTGAFLKEKLAHIGLKPHEYNDFITFWLPRLNENPWNFIHFSLNEEFEKTSTLTVNPQPDAFIRVMMEYCGLDEYRMVAPQNLPQLKRTGFTLVEWGGVKFDPSHVVFITAPDHTVKPAKPIIYLYPQTEQQVSVKLGFKGTLTATYPAYNGEWKVKATPSGKLTNLADGRPHNYLFYEGDLTDTYSVRNGFVVAKSNTISFLQENLSRIGLKPNEYNDMISYWLPQLNEHEWNFIHFSINEEYDRSCTLEVSPKPDSYIRVMMEFCGLQSREEVYPQLLPELKREGFTLVEWGGMKIPAEKMLGAIEPQLMKKPVIYLYPETPTEVKVQLQTEATLTATYPPLGDGWKVLAHPGGKLLNLADGREYEYLFYEGLPPMNKSYASGFCIPREETIPFLERALAQLGLTAKEANDMIAFWLPELNEKPWNYIHFTCGKEFDQYSKLQIQPQPQTTLRVMMEFAGLDEKIQVELQALNPVERKGFTVVEWGGIHLSPLQVQASRNLSASVK